MSDYAKHTAVEVFESSRTMFEALVGELTGPDCARSTHAELEEQLTERSRQLMRQLLQDHLDLRAIGEQRRPEEVTGADGVRHARVERGHTRRSPCA